MSRLTIASCLARIAELENTIALRDTEIDDLKTEKAALERFVPASIVSTEFGTFSAAKTAACELAASSGRSCKIQRHGTGWILA